jgi:hypothetical protein
MLAIIIIIIIIIFPDITRRPQRSCGRLCPSFKDFRRKLDQSGRRALSLSTAFYLGKIPIYALLFLKQYYLEFCLIFEKTLLNN